MIKAALFDIDGTLLDSNDFIYKAFDYILKINNYPQIPQQKMAELMGLELDYIYSQFAPGSDSKMLAKAHIEFQEKNLHLTHPFPGALDALQSLQRSGTQKAAITNRSNITTRKSLELTGLFPFFEQIYTLNDVVNPKPNPEAVFKALTKFGLGTKDAVMIGDTETDVQTGKNAGVRTIGVTYGMQGDKIKSSNPDFLIRDISEVLPILEKLT